MRHHLVATLAALTALTCQVPLAAQINWVVNPANGHSYAVGPNTTSWSAGEALAVAEGGHLVTIRSASEQAWIEANFTSELGAYGLWIGFNDLGVEGQWVWVSGEPVTYTNWSPGNPNNGSTYPENAGHLFGTNAGPSQWMWNDETEWFSGILRPLIERAPASYAAFGTGCPGPSSPVPNLSSAPGELPRLTTTSHLIVSNLPTSVTIPVFVIGFSNTWDPDGYGLPLDLGVLGWNGCQQLVSDEILFWSITTTGQASQPIAIPAGAPVGFTFFVQALVLYTPTGVAVSNAIAGVVGY